MIRQAISCDICAIEKQQTNHWFVASEQGGELRLSGWSSRYRLRPGMKHLCGQICLHKLVDEFMARTISVRGQAADEAPESSQLLATHPVPASPDLVHASGEAVPSAAVSPQPEPSKPLPLRAPAELLTVAPRPTPAPSTPPEESSRYTSRNWRAEAWDRERERELHAVGRRPESLPRRRSGS